MYTSKYVSKETYGCKSIITKVKKFTPMVVCCAYRLELSTYIGILDSVSVRIYMV